MGGQTDLHLVERQPELLRLDHHALEVGAEQLGPLRAVTGARSHPCGETPTVHRQ